MTFGKKLAELDVKSLIEIIENPENWGTQYQIRAMDELDSRNVSLNTINELAIEVSQVFAYKIIMNEDDVTKEELSMHKSKFLSDEEIKEIYIQQLDKYIKYKDQFRFDVWSYAIGGI